MKNTITYTNMFQNTSCTIPVGKDYDVKREDGDFCLARGIACDCPVTVAILIRKDGRITWLYTEFDGNCNAYWHFSNLSGSSNPITQEQKNTLSAMQDGMCDGLMGLSGALGYPVLEWAFGKKAADISRAMHS